MCGIAQDIFLGHSIVIMIAFRAWQIKQCYYIEEGTSMLEKKIILPMVGEMSCGECTACCVSFPLLPNRKYWPEGKKVGVPCRYLGTGCTIHNQPRPEVCTSYQCAWREGKFGPDVEWRPDRSGLMIYANTLLSLFQGHLRAFQDRGMFQRWTDLDTGIGIVETRPRALVECDLGAVRSAWKSCPTRIGSWWYSLTGLTSCTEASHVCVSPRKRWRLSGLARRTMPWK